MKSFFIVRAYERAVNALSFSSELYRLRRELNARIDQPTSVERSPRSHPLGLARWFKRRRISIAESYILVLNDLEAGRSKARLKALRQMVEISFHAKTLDMPLNTARVQLALVKEAVKQRGDRRRQLELLQDFSVSSHGQYHVIRRLLHEHNMLELPETGRPLRELDAGRDLHVHETSTSGRKNPTQLLLDAFIKGVSELTIVFQSASSLGAMMESVEAGRLVGIKVNLALEVSVNVDGRRFHFMALLPELEKPKDVRRFFSRHEEELRGLLAGLEDNRQNRAESVRRLLKHFNENFRGALNEGFPDKRAYRVPKLRMRDLALHVPAGSVNRMQLGDYLYAVAKPVFFNRVLLLKVRRERAARGFAAGLVSQWDLQVAETKYRAVREEYRELNPEALRRRYFDNPSIADYPTVFDDLPGLRASFQRAACRLRLIQPLEHGLERALALLDSAASCLDEVEIYNMQDSIRRDSAEVLAFCRRVNELNARAFREGRPALVPVCGSDSNGRIPEIPGMGFIFADRVTGRGARAYLRRHVALPAAVARMVAAGGKPVDLEAKSAGPALLAMGKVAPPVRNRVGDEEDHAAAPLSPGRAFRYLNPLLVDLLHVGVGFLVASHFIGTGYALLWLGITGFRAAVADLVAAWGARFRAWNIRSVNVDNVSRALFWTGFSVPILGFVKGRFDFLWPFAASGLLYNGVKFFFISGVNGLYLATHNRLRGFDRNVVRANFFRSVLSWPFATLFAPLGNLAGIPSIVQAKLWSDVVAGFIEGGSKYRKILKLRKRDLEEIVPRLEKGGREDRTLAILDLLYLWREEPRTKSSLAAILGGPGPNLVAALASGTRPAILAPARAAAAPPPEGSGGTEATPRPPRAAELLAVVAGEAREQSLVDYILANYSHEAAVDLVNLVSDSLPDFRDWLAARSSAEGSASAAREPEGATAGQE